MQQQQASSKRKNRLLQIRKSMQQNLVVQKRTLTIQSKIEERKKRRQSFQLNEQLANSQQLFDDLKVQALNVFKQRYEMGEKIGEGSNGLVRKCYSKDEGSKQEYAVKIMNMEQQQILFLKNNFRHIRALDHPNIIKYHVMYLDLRNNTCYLVMDFQNMPNLLAQKNLFTLDQIKNIMYQLFRTIAYLHSHDICHRDIKPENILFDSNTNQIKLIDFGISKKIIDRGNKRDMLTITGTPYYRAPEMFTGGGYNEMVDMWAAGITMYKLIAGVTPFQSQYNSTTIENILRGELKFEEPAWEKTSTVARDLVTWLLKSNKSERLKAEEAKKHFWFNTSMMEKEQNPLMRSDWIPKNIKKDQCDYSEQKQDFSLKRSLTNHKNPTQNNEKVNIKKIYGSRWLDNDLDDHIVIAIDSEEQLESPYSSEKIDYTL